jgi:hypothetical protein
VAGDPEGAGVGLRVGDADAVGVGDGGPSTGGAGGAGGTGGTGTGATEDDVGCGAGGGSGRPVGPTVGSEVGAPVGVGSGVGWVVGDGERDGDGDADGEGDGEADGEGEGGGGGGGVVVSCQTNRPEPARPAAVWSSSTATVKRKVRVLDWPGCQPVGMPVVRAESRPDQGDTSGSVTNPEQSPM